MKLKQTSLLILLLVNAIAIDSMNIFDFGDYVQKWEEWASDLNVTGVIRQGGQLLSDLYCSITGCNMTGDLFVNGSINVTGNLTADYIFGDGSQLTNVNYTIDCEDCNNTFINEGGDLTTGNYTFTGNITADNFIGDGSLLTNINATMDCEDCNDTFVNEWETWNDTLQVTQNLTVGSELESGGFNYYSHNFTGADNVHILNFSNPAHTELYFAGADGYYAFNNRINMTNGLAIPDDYGTTIRISSGDNLVNRSQLFFNTKLNTTPSIYSIPRAIKFGQEFLDDYVFTFFGNITANYFIGDGSQLTGITASVEDIWVNETGDTMSGNLTVNANVSALYFSGNGSLLTDIDHTNLLNIGTYNHSQIDTHVDNSSLHFDLRGNCSSNNFVTGWDDNNIYCNSSGTGGGISCSDCDSRFVNNEPQYNIEIIDGDFYPSLTETYDLGKNIETLNDDNISIEDSYIDENNPSDNFDTETIIYVGNSTGIAFDDIIVLGFDLNEEISKEVSIDSAIFRYTIPAGGAYCFGTANDVDLWFDCENDFDESTITWNNDNMNCNKSISLGTWSGSGSAITYDKSITSVVNGWLNGTYSMPGFFRLETEADASNNFCSIHSKEVATSAYRPRLLLNYTIEKTWNNGYFQNIFASYLDVNNIDVDKITSSIIVNSGNLTVLGNATFDGFVNATSLYGDGSQLTGLNSRFIEELPDDNEEYINGTLYPLESDTYNLGKQYIQSTNSSIDKDTWIDEENPDTNYGSDTDFEVSNWYDFGVPAHYHGNALLEDTNIDSVLTSCSSVDSAYLWLQFNTAGGNGDMKIQYNCSGSFTENFVTWNNNNVTCQNYIEYNIDSYSWNDVVGFDITHALQCWKNDTCINDGLFYLINVDDYTGHTNFYSSESSPSSVNPTIQIDCTNYNKWNTIYTNEIYSDDYYSEDGNSGITNTTGFWLCTSNDCSSTCQVQIESGLITGCT